LQISEQPIIARTIILLAHELGLQVIAEGIENEVMLKQLLGLGCSFDQGFHFAPALEAIDARAWLYRHCKSWGVNEG
jgi:EAL domain-containing protein (putative c-di-GMP-specific phosphodiesterase class I)